MFSAKFTPKNIKLPLSALRFGLDAEQNDVYAPRSKTFDFLTIRILNAEKIPSDDDDDAGFSPTKSSPWLSFTLKTDKRWRFMTSIMIILLPRQHRPLIPMISDACNDSPSQLSLNHFALFVGTETLVIFFA